MLAAILKKVAELTMYRSKLLESFVLPAGTGQEQPKATDIPIFINPKALTFPVLVGLVKGAWAAASLLPVAWATSIFLPLVMCLTLGTLIAISNLMEQPLRVVDWITGITIGLLNSLVVFGAVMAIPKTGH